MLKYRNAKLCPGWASSASSSCCWSSPSGLQPERLISWATGIRYSAEFAEAGGLSFGQRCQGLGRQGRHRHRRRARRARCRGDVRRRRHTVRLGDQTTAHIRTGSLLGRADHDAGTGRLDGSMHIGDVIPLSRTGSPYSLNEAVNDLTTNVAATDTDRAQSVAGHTLGNARSGGTPTRSGLRRADPAVAVAEQPQRDARQTCCSNAATVTQVLAERSQQVNTLILNANDLLAVLVERRQSDQRTARQHRRGGREPDRARQGQRSRTRPDTLIASTR